jgi:toxin ParE1/3/4
MNNYRISSLAYDDLEQIFLYIAERNLEAARKLLKEMTKQFDLAARNSSIGSARDEFMVGVRMFPYKKYNIYYFRTEAGIEVFRVLHSARDQSEAFDSIIEGPDTEQ